MPTPTETKNCWTSIGVEGDRSCSELKTFTHCRNCPVYSTTGRNLLEREAPPDYVAEWTQLLAQTKVEAKKQQSSLTQTQAVIIFRLCLEWLALPASLFKEVTQVSTIHRLPHRSSSILLGVTNIRGELQMCISLSAFLGVETAAISQEHISLSVYRRMLIVEKEGNTWVFPVDEIYGVYRLTPDELRKVPANVAKSTNTYTKSIISWQSKNVVYLDDELLFYTLKKNLL